MTEKSLDQLDKVLALADSDHDGEALGALRMARRLLIRSGLTFADLAYAARRSCFSLSRNVFSPAVIQLEAKIDQMHDELDAHVAQNQKLSLQLEGMKARVSEMEKQLVVHQAETAHWKETARATAERLWDLGQLAHAEAMATLERPDDGASSDEDEAPVLIKAVG